MEAPPRPADTAVSAQPPRRQRIRRDVSQQQSLNFQEPKTLKNSVEASFTATTLSPSPRIE
jgi:hypothetical protein